jgi:hypothetical protein
VAGFGPQLTIAGEDAELLRGPLGLPVGHAGYGCHGGNAATGPFQLHNGSRQISPFLSCDRSR